MNLKTFNATNATKKGRVSEFFFRTYRGNGQCYFSPSTVRLLDLQLRDMIAFHQDVDDENWYIEKVIKDGLEVRNMNDNELGFNSAKIVRELYDSMAFTGGFGKIMIDPVPVPVGPRRLYRLDLSNLKNN